MDFLIPIISNLISPSTDEETRRDLQQKIMDSFSEPLINSFLDIVKSNEIPFQIRTASAVILSSILKSLDNTKFQNLSSYLSPAYSLISELIFISNSYQESHVLSDLLSRILRTLVFLPDGISEIPFFKDLFTNLLNSPTSFSFHGFYFTITELLTELSLSDYCDETFISDLFSILIAILQKNIQNLSEHLQSESKKNDEIARNSIEAISLCQNLFEQEDLTDFFKENDQLICLIQNLFPFLNFSSTFSSTMYCFSSAIEYFPCIFEESLSQLIDNSISFLDSLLTQDPEIIRNSFLAFLTFLNNASKSCFQFIIQSNFGQILTFLIKIMSNSPPNCDLKSDWEPHIASQICLQSILSEISDCLSGDESTSSEFVNLINGIATATAPQLQSPTFSERATSLQVFQLLIIFFDNSYFIPIKTIVLDLLLDPTPRVRNASIICLTEYVKSIPNHRCNDEQYDILNDIYQASKPHINEREFMGNQDDILLISLSTFSLFHSLSLISGFENLQELASLIFLNLPFLFSVFSKKHMNKLLNIIKQAHFCIIHAYPVFEQLFLSCFLPENMNENIKDLISFLVDIDYEFIDRFGQKIPISPEFMETLVQFILSTNFTSALPLTGLILSKFPAFSNTIPMISVFSFQQFQVLPNNHSIVFFKILIESNLLTNELLQELFGLVFPFCIHKFDSNIPLDLLTNSINVALQIFQKIPELISPEILTNFKLIFRPYQVLQYAKNDIKRIYVTTINNIEIAFTLFPFQLFDEELVSNCITYIITLQNQSYRNIHRIMKILIQISENYQELFVKVITEDSEEFEGFLEICLKDTTISSKIVQLMTNLGIKII